MPHHPSQPDRLAASEKGGLGDAAGPGLRGLVLPVAGTAASDEPQLRDAAAIQRHARVGHHMARDVGGGIELRTALSAGWPVVKVPPLPGVQPGGAHGVDVEGEAHGSTVSKYMPIPKV